MSLAMGPYTKNNINGSNNPSVTFWGFDEPNTNNLLRYRMDNSVKNAIKKTFEALGKVDPDDPSKLAFMRGWTETLHSGSTSTLADTVKFYNQLFNREGMEVLPYVYMLKTGYEGVQQTGTSSYTSTVTVGQNKYAACSAFNNKGNPAGISELIDTFYHNHEGMPSDFDIELYGSYDKSSASSQAIGDLNYILTDMYDTDKIKSQELLTEEDATSTVHKANFTTNGPQYYRGSNISEYYVKYTSENDLFSQNLSTHSTLSCGTSSGVSFLGDDLKFCTGVFTLDNSNDEEISSTNQRATCMNRYKSDMTTLSAVKPHQNPLFFFVKVPTTWYTYNPLGDPQVDTNFPSYMYYAFNINALFYPTNTLGYSGYYDILPGTSVSYGGRQQIYTPNGFCALPMSSNNHYNSDCASILQLPYAFYLPFAYYIKNETDYFTTSTGVYSCQYQPTSVQTNFPANSYLKGATRMGTFIAGTSDEWEDFFRNGLGLYATTLDYTEFTSKPTSEWENVPVPPVPPGPEEDPDPGSGGQSPVSPIGGSGSGYGTSDNITAEINENSNTGTGGARITEQWNMTPSTVQALQECLVNDNLWEAVKTLFKSDYKQGIINLLYFPFDITPYYSGSLLETVNVLGIPMDFSGISAACKGYKMPKNTKTCIKWAEFDIDGGFKSFLDYQYTNIDLYLPFIGHVGLDPVQVMQRKIKVIYDIDFGDGSCLATVWATNSRNFSDTNFHIVLSQKGQMGTIVPLGSSDGLLKSQQKLESGLSLALGAGTAIVTAGTGMALTTAALSGGLSGVGIMSNQPNYNAGGVVDSNHTLSVSLKCILTITYPETDIPVISENVSYGKINGYTTNLYTQLENMSGYTVCQDVKLDNIVCTYDERNELKSLLEGGVII